MMSPIFKIQNRGQVVNNACQWLWENRRLAFRMMVLPTLIGAIALGLNLVFADFWFIYVLVALYVVLILPVLPSLMFHVVEHPEESGYPEHMPKMKAILRPWWGYFYSLLIVSFVSFIVLFVASFTIIGGFVVSFFVPFAIVVGQREKGTNARAIVQAFLLAKNSFGNFCMVALGNLIITISMMAAPFTMVYLLMELLRFFVTKTVAFSLNSMFNGDFFLYIAVFVMILGGVFSVQIVTVIYHFFYGHCVEKESHPALIEQMEKFDEE